MSISSDRETITTLEQQLKELHELTINLKLEMEVYDRLVKQLGVAKDQEMKKATPSKFSMLTKIQFHIIFHFPSRHLPAQSQQ